MSTRYLIDGIVRQTTVLIAQLSTASGVRAPLAHVADQVFRDLSREIERQGVGRKVVADMFGMALRTYQTKLQRLDESASQRNQTLWGAVLDHIAQAGAATRRDIETRFRHDNELAVRSVLRDLVGSGLVYCAGKGPSAIYRATSDAERQVVGDAADAETLAALVWVHVYRNGPVDGEALAQVWPSAAGQLPDVLQRLQSEGRITRVDGPGTPHYRAEELSIPVGSEQGWEGAVLDHFRAMAASIAHKLHLGSDPGALAGQVGGATLTFDLYEGHPHEGAVRALLQRVRGEVNELWNAVKHANETPPPPDARRFRVTFYVGQNVEEQCDE